MRKVFSSNEVTETVLIQDALSHHDVHSTIQNEHSGRVAAPAFRAPAEIWVTNDDDYERARKIVVATLSVLDSKSEGKPWVCTGCGEENPLTFEVCWNCGLGKNTESSE